MEVCKTSPSLGDLALNVIVSNFYNAAVKILRIQKECVQDECVQGKFVKTLFKDIYCVLENNSPCHEECRLLLDPQCQEFLRMAESGILNKKSCHCIPSVKRLHKWLEFLDSFQTAMDIYEERCQTYSEELFEFSCCCWCLKYGLKLITEVVKFEECNCFRQEPNNTDDSREGNSISQNVKRYRRNCISIDTITQVQRKFIQWIQEMLYDCAFTACQELKSETHKQILPFFSDKFTELLLNRIETVYLKIGGKSTSHHYVPKYFMSELVAAVIHPSVKSVYLLRNLSNLSNELLKNTSCLQNIEVLKLKIVYVENNLISDKLFVSGIQAMKKLRVFRYNCCTESVLEALVKNCRHLKCLNVKCSQKLNDCSTVLFAGFRHLKKLNILRTCIKDVASILNALDVTEIDEFGNTSRCSLLLKSFGCNIESSSQLHIITTKLPNITELKMYTSYPREIDLFLVKNVPFLQSVSVIGDHCNFQDIQTILSAKGKELLKLTMHNVRNVDMGAVSINCPVLTQLSLKWCTFIAEPLCQQDVAFPALKRLFLDLISYSYVPSLRYPNIEYLKFYCHDIEVHDIVQVSELEIVKEFVLMLSKLQEELLGEFIDRCVKSERFTLCLTGNVFRYVNIEQAVSHVKTMYPRLHVIPTYSCLM